MKSPVNSSQITPAWLEFMLTKYESKKAANTFVSVVHFNSSCATKPGESFNAELVKLEVNAKVKKRGEIGIPKYYHLIAKFLNVDPLNREMVCKVKYHIREYEMYSRVIKRLNEFQAAQTNNAYPIKIPELIFGKWTNKEYVLVFENVKVNGYDTASKCRGLNLEQLKLAVESLARLHGVSYAYNKYYNFLAEFPTFRFNKNISKLFRAVVLASIDNVLPLLRLKNMNEIADCLENGKRNLPQKFEELWKDQSQHAIMCLTHGDFWCNNLMFRADKDGRASEVSVIDWQISQWNNPIMDLQYILGTSTTRNLRTKHTKEILKLYHSTFIQVTRTLNSCPPKWSFGEFKAEFERLSLVGLLMGICIIQGTLSKAGEKLNIQANDDKSCFCCLKPLCKSIAAKVAIPLAFSNYGNIVLRLSIKDAFKPIGLELLSGKNELMNKRLLDLIEEAHCKGILNKLKSS